MSVISKFKYLGYQGKEFDIKKCHNIKTTYTPKADIFFSVSPHIFRAPRSRKSFRVSVEASYSLKPKKSTGLYMGL